MMLNMETVMAQPGAREDLERLTATLEKDPEAGALLKAMQSIEDVYDFVKRYAKVKFEAVKEMFNDAVNYFKEDKVALKDEMLDNVVGGGFWSNLWNNKIVKYATATVLVASFALTGMLTGMAVGSIAGPVTSVVGAVGGLIAGCVAGLAMADTYILN